MPTVTPLADAVDPARVGHKAAHLALMIRAGLDVPDGIVVACDVTADERELAEFVLTHGGGPFAVRSSSVAEDLADASFAGQYESVLDVRDLAGVMDAITRVRASASSARVVGYGGRPTTGMAVLIQPMIIGDASGVAFSANPITGDRTQVMVTVTRGLGDALVSGHVVGDEWLVDGDAVRPVVQTQHAIGVSQVRQVADLARRVEAHLGCAADIEWTMAADRLVLLQARPITVLPTRPDIEPPHGTWQKDTTHFPEPITPFGASTYAAYAAPAFDALIGAWGMLPDRIEARVIGHELYMHVVPDDGGKQPPPWWVLAMAVRLVPALRRKLRTSREVVEAGWLDSIPDTWEAVGRARLQADIERLASVDLGALDDRALTEYFQHLITFATEAMAYHFRLTVPYVVGVHEFVTTCAQLLGLDLAGAMLMLQGLSVTSSAPTRELADVAALVRVRPHVIADLDAPDALAKLYADPIVGPALRAWMARWGLRTIGYDPGQPSVAERPSLVLGLLAELLQGPRELDLAAQRARAVAEARARLSGAALARFDRTLAVAERVYPLREDNVLYTDNLPAGLVRRVGLEMGRRLVAEGRLTHATDMVMLSPDEMRSTVDLRPLVAQRRAEIAWVRAHPGPLFYGPRPGQAPDLRGLPEAARRLNSALIWAMEEEITPAAPGERDGVSGLAASAGVATGRVRVIRSAADIEVLQAGEVLVCPITTPAWTLVFSRAAALVTDGGSVLSHAAIVAREHGLPAVVATGNATSRLRDGQLVTVDGIRGTVTALHP